MTDNLSRLIYNLSNGENIKTAVEESTIAEVSKTEEVRKLVQTNNTKTENVKLAIENTNKKLDTIIEKLDAILTAITNK